MNCKNCGQKISAKTTVCPQCGNPIEQPNKKPFYKKWWFWLIVAFFVLGAIGSGMESSEEPKDGNSLESSTSQTDSSNVPEKTDPEETDAPSEPTQTEPPAQSKEDYIADCLELNKDLGYKDLLRNPDNYVGQKVKVIVKISQIMDQSLFSSAKYYFGRTDNNGHGWYFDDEICFTDGRIDDDMKILEDDIVVIYGEFVGLKEFNRALTGSSTEMPVIEFKYIELVEDD